MSRPSAKQSVWIYATGVAIAAVTFVIDLALPRAAAPVAYCAVVVLLAELRRQRIVFFAAAICSVLMVLGHVLGPGQYPEWISLFTRGSLIGVIWLVVVLALMRQKALADLQKRTDELARSNAELDHFASLVAHDLRAPLVSVNGCVELLAEHLKDRPGEAAELLGYVRASTGRMGRLIQRVLEHARAGSEPLHMESCEMESSLEEVLENLKALVASAGAEIAHARLPRVWIDRVQLGRVLQNLIENAIKYRGSEPLRIYIAARLSGKHWEFAVRDNGIGVKPEEFEKIFELFDRGTSGPKTSDGVGIGLATCRKIIERHGGRMWVESKPGQGSAFCFSLPRTTES